MKSPKLSDSEWKILSLLWESEPMTITQITAALKPTAGWSKSTVITLLNRMEEKNAVSYEQGKNARLYYSVLTRKQAAVPETRSFLKRMYNGSLGLMLNSLVSQGELSEDEINELSAIIENVRNEKGENTENAGKEELS
ncbi:MAG: BlaI/MecI/CopY family transcriptional regulator [Ruminococcus sp.]|nr:BlaI/MecI/CopY family transcriptional regulator [Ruminococcus sp.]